MKKLLMVALVSLGALCLAGCSPAGEEKAPVESATQEAAPKTYALVVKSVENPYMTTMYEGFKTACSELGIATPLLVGPGSQGSPSQSEALDLLLTQQTDAIAIAANDMDEVSAMLAQAKNQGIPVVSLDSMVYPLDRKIHIQQASPETIGRVLIQACAKMMDNTGEFAILTTTDAMPNQSTWVQWMRRELSENPELYAGMTLVETVYGMDEEKPSTDATAYLLKTYPNLKVIIAPTVVGLHAAAAEIERTGSAVRVTGLGLPSAMEKYIANGICPWMYLWNPSEVGYLSAYALHALSEGSVGGEVGEILSAGSLGDKIITESTDGGTEIVLGNPKVFDMTNIAVWGELF